MPLWMKCHSRDRRIRGIGSGACQRHGVRRDRAITCEKEPCEGVSAARPVDKTICARLTLCVWRGGHELCDVIIPDLGLDVVKRYVVSIRQRDELAIRLPRWAFENSSCAGGNVRLESTL